MATIRRADDIFHAEGGWFDARWHFSFSHYRDPEQMGVGPLRVFNDDRIVAGAEWPMHPHRDIESLTYVVEGSFDHADSLGNGGVFGPGAAQVMTFSSRGAQHSERNGSDETPLRFIQFWVLPGEEGLANAVQQHQFSADERTDRWLPIMSPEGGPGLDLHQDAWAYVSRLTAGGSLTHRVAERRGGYLYVIDGAVTLDGEQALTSGDAVKIDAGPEELELRANAAAELLLLDVTLDWTPIGIWAG